MEAATVAMEAVMEAATAIAEVMDMVAMGTEAMDMEAMDMEAMDTEDMSQPATTRALITYQADTDIAGGTYQVVTEVTTAVGTNARARVRNPDKLTSLRADANVDKRETSKNLKRWRKFSRRLIFW